jgi:hypothetical protein
MLGGGRHGALVVTHHVLPVVPLARRVACRRDAREVHPPIDVARLDGLHAEVVHQRVGGVHLRLVVRRVAARLVVADEPRALLTSVIGQ